MMYLHRITFIFSLILLLVSCEKEEIAPKVGQFILTAENGTNNARTTDTPTPAFASFTIKMADGQIFNRKMELHSFNEEFLTTPHQLVVGNYSLEVFQILDSNNAVIYASPLVGSELAYLVDHPLPMVFTITKDQTTFLSPEVLSIQDHTPQDFGYAKFGFSIVEKFDFVVRTTIAENNPPDEVEYTLEIIAKDAPLGNVEWTTSLPMSALDTIHIPAKHNHYTFKAIKNGYISHIQHFLKEEVSQYTHLNFEFIPESLDGFIKYLGTDESSVRIYIPNDQNRCKVYTRIDLPEDYQLAGLQIEISALSIMAGAIAEMKAIYLLEYGHQLPTRINLPTRVNVFDNKPYAEAADYCAEFDLTASNFVTIPEHALMGHSFFLEFLNKPWHISYHERLPLITPPHP